MTIRGSHSPETVLRDKRSPIDAWPFYALSSIWTALPSRFLPCARRLERVVAAVVMWAEAEGELRQRDRNSHQRLRAHATGNTALEPRNCALAHPGDLGQSALTDVRQSPGMPEPSADQVESRNRPGWLKMTLVVAVPVVVAQHATIQVSIAYRTVSPRSTRTYLKLK